MIEYKSGDEGYGRYINGRDAFIEFVTQRQARDLDFTLGVIDEMANWLIVSGNENMFMAALNETKEYYEED